MKTAKYSALTLFAMLAAHASLVNLTPPLWGWFAEVLPWMRPLLEPHLRQGLGQPHVAWTIFWVGVVLALSVVFLWLILRSKSEQSVRRIGYGWIVLCLVLRLVWVAVFDSKQASDFGVYWWVGGEVAAGRVGDLDVKPVYVERSMLYTLPVRFLFGDSQTALELLNVSLVTLAMVAFFLFALRATSAKVAACSLVFFLWNPDLWYGVTLANHDIAFLPALAGLMLLVGVLEERLKARDSRWAGLLLCSVAVGVMVFVVDIQRGFGIPLWLGLLFVFLHHGWSESLDTRGGRVPGSFRKPVPRIAMAFAILVLVPYGSARLCDRVFRHVTGIAPGSGVVELIAGVDIYKSASSRDVHVWRQTYLPQHPTESRAALSLRKLVQELTADPVETIRYCVRKNTILAKPTTTLMFATWPGEGESLGRLNRTGIPTQRLVQHLLTGLLMFLLSLRLCLGGPVPVRKGLGFLVASTVVFYLSVLALTEAQGRYDVFTVFLVSLLVGDAAVQVSNCATWRPAVRRAVTRIGIGTLGLVASLVLLFVASPLLAALNVTPLDLRGFEKGGGEAPQALLDWSRVCGHDPRHDPAGESPWVTVRSKRFNRLVLRVRSLGCGSPVGPVVWNVPVRGRAAGTARMLSFFVSADKEGAGKSGTSECGRVQLSVWADRELLWAGFADEFDHPTLVSCPIDLSQGSAGQLSIGLCAPPAQDDPNSEGSMPAMDVTIEYVDLR